MDKSRMDRSLDERIRDAQLELERRQKNNTNNGDDGNEDDLPGSLVRELDYPREDYSKKKKKTTDLER